MKKIFCFFAAFLLCLSVFIITVSADTLQNPAGSEYSEFLSDLPDSVGQRLPDSVNGKDLEVDARELTAWDFLLGAVGSAFSEQLRSIFPAFCTILGLILISSALNAVKTSLEPKTARLLGLCSGCVIAAAFVGLQIDTLRVVSEYLSDLTLLTSGMTPVVVVLYAAGGNVSSSAVSGSAITVFLSLSENMLSRSVIPFAGCCLCLVTLSSTATQVGLEGLIKLIKRAYTTFLTFLMSIMCAILGIQNIIAAGSDSISLRAARFVAGSAIPVVGGSVSESMRTLAASISMLRKCFGVSGIVMIAVLTLPPLFLLLLTRLSLNAASAAAELLGCEVEKHLLDGIAGIHGCLAAVVSACSLMFIFLLTLLASSTVAIGA